MPPPQRRRRSPEVYAQRAFSRPLHWRQQASYAGATARPDRSQCNLLDTPGLYAVYTPRTAIERAGAAVILRSLVRILEAIDYLRFLPRGGCRGRSALRPARRTRRVNVTMLEWLATDASVEFADVSARHGAPPAATARSGDRSGHDHSRQPNGTLIRGASANGANGRSRTAMLRENTGASLDVCLVNASCTSERTWVGR